MKEQDPFWWRWSLMGVNDDCKGPMLAFRVCSSEFHRPWDASRQRTSINYKRRIHCRAVSNRAATELDWFSLSGLPLEEALVQWQGDNTYPVELCKEQDLHSAAHCVAEAFFVPSPISILNRLLFLRFQAGVLDGMHGCLRYNREGFAVLAVRDEEQHIQGAVQISRQSEQRVLQHLPEETTSYAYVSSMAVKATMRRKGFGRALLAAAEFVGWLWGEDEVVLHVYSDNASAKALYLDNGFVEIPEAAMTVGLFGGQEMLLLRRDYEK